MRFSALQGMDPDVVQCQWKDGAETAAEIDGNGGKAEMKLRKCANGHFYDERQYDNCPFC